MRGERLGKVTGELGEHQESCPGGEMREVMGEGGQRRDGRGHGKVRGGIKESHEEVPGGGEDPKC